MQKENSVTDLREKLRGSRSSLSSKAPKLCKVCNRASFLKCMECDTIYCSSKCQIKDWENHQYQHLKVSSNNNSSRGPMQPKFTNQKHESVQNRLKAAVEREPTKVNIDEQIKKLDEFELQPNHHQVNNEASQTAMDVDEITADLNSVRLTELPHPMAEEESFIKQTLSQMLSIRTFKRHVALDEEWKDAEGFSFVTITDFDKRPEGTMIYWVMPQEVRESYNAYKLALEETYACDDRPTISMDDLAQFKKHMVISKIGDDWVRASILNISAADKVLGLEDIDTGKKTIKKLPRDIIKLPLEQELHKSAYAFKVIFENCEEKLEIGDVIKLRITQEVPYAFDWAVIKIDGNQTPLSSPEAEKTSEFVKSTPSKENARKVAVKEKEKEDGGKWKRYTIDEIQVKDMRTGSNVKLLYVDGSHLEKGILHVCESRKENWDFFDRMEREIAEYVKENPSVMQFTPVVRELVLAKFSNGEYYRAVCLEASKVDAKLAYIDYGSVCTVDLSCVMQLPAKMLHTCCSHAVIVKLSSGRSIGSLDFEESRKMLLETNEFEARVDKEGKKYIVTIDDSLVVHRKV